MSSTKRKNTLNKQTKPSNFETGEYNDSSEEFTWEPQNQT